MRAKLSAATFLCALLLVCPSAWAGEKVLIPELPGWKVVVNLSDPAGDMLELAPEKEDAGKGMRRAGVVAVRRPGMTTETFIQTLKHKMGDLCESLAVGPVHSRDNLGGVFTVACGRYKSTEIGTFSVYRTFQGGESFTVVDRTWKGPAFALHQLPVEAEEIEAWTTFVGAARRVAQ